MLSLILMIFSSFISFASTGMDANCASYIQNQKLATFTNQNSIEGTYQERKATYDYLKKNNYPVSDYYQLVEKNPLTGNYEVDKFNPLLDTERQYHFDKIKKDYKAVIAEVKTTTQKNNYAEEYFDPNGNFRSMHQCADNTQCLGYRAYCSEQVASKGVVDHMQLYLRVNEACSKGKLRQNQTPEEFVEECDKAVSNLNYLSNEGKEIQKIAATKDAKTQDFFYGVNKEFSAFKNKWDVLKKEIAAKKKQDDEIQAQKLLDEKLAKQNAEMDKKLEHVRVEMNKCAAVSVSRDKDVKGRNLAQGLCARLGAPEDSTNQYQNLNLHEDALDKLADQVNEVEQQVVDQMAEKMSQAALHQSLMSLWLVERPMPQNAAEAEKSACKVAPQLCKLKGFDSTIKNAFKEFEDKSKDKAFKSLDLAGRKDALYSDIKPAMNKMNELCSTYRAKVQRDIYQFQKDEAESEPAYYQNDNTRVDQTRVKNNIDQHLRSRDGNKLLNELLPLYSGMVDSRLGHLLITDTFKAGGGVGYFSPQKMEEHCYYGGGQLFKDVNEAQIVKADSEFRTLVKDELKKINDEFGAVNILAKNSVTDFLKLDDDKRDELIKQHLKTNPLTLIKMLQENPDPEFVKALCKYIMSIEDADYRKRVGEYILAGVGFVAGVALSCTGIGSPLGMGLLAFSMGITTIQVGNIIDEKVDHAKQAKLLEQSGATGQMEFDLAIRESLKEDKLAEGGVSDVLWTVGPELAGFGVGKLLKLGNAVSKFQRFKSIQKLSRTSGTKNAVSLEKGVEEIKEASEGIKYIEKNVGADYLKANPSFSALNNEEILQMGSLMNSLDDANKVRFLQKLKEFQTPAEMRAFLKQAHLSIDDLIVNGKLSSTKLFATADKVTLKTAEPFQELVQSQKQIEKLPAQAPVRKLGRVDYSNLDAKEYAFYKYVMENSSVVKTPLVIQKSTSMEKLAVMYQNNSAKDMKYLVDTKQVKSNFSGGEADIFVNPSNRKEAIKIWNSYRLDDFELSVKTVQLLEQRVLANKKLSNSLYVAKIHEKGSNYIVKEFFENSVELKTVINNPEVVSAMKNIKRELLRSPDILDQKMYRALTRKPPSANYHWDPQTKKVILIDALGF